MNEETLANTAAKEEQKAINTACRILAIREHSRKQLVEKLQKKGFSKPSISGAVTYLLQENWLSEERFCHSYIRSRAAKGQGELRIEMELQQHGLSNELIDKGFGELAIDWWAVCEETAFKKLRMMTSFDSQTFETDLVDSQVSETESIKSLSYQQKNQQKMKLERFLRYRGFASDMIRKTITKCLNSRSPLQ